MEKVKRVVLVTGAARGIGLEIATALAEEGHRIVLIDRLEDVHAAANKLVKSGVEATSFIVDLVDETAITSTVEEARKRFGEIGILVNNAGISGRNGNNKTPVVEMELSDWDRVMQINLTAAFLMCRACLPSMAIGRWGRIINMASQAARTRTERSNAHYAASKSALVGFSRGLAMEVAAQGITVNCLAPGRISTPMTVQTGSEVDKAYSDKSAVGKVGLPEDIAAAALYLTSEDAGFVTGMTLDVNGGYSMN